MRHLLPWAVLVLAVLPLPVAHATDRAEATLQDAQGETVGKAVLRDATRGVLIEAEVWNLPGRSHAIHIHEAGRCEPPFDSAGGHFNPDGRSHGFADPEGAHAGDLPNLHLPPQAGRHRFEMFVPGVSLDGGPKALLDADGAALVIHEKPDDYRTDPAGDAGGRIACGEIAPTRGAAVTR